MDRLDGSAGCAGRQRKVLGASATSQASDDDSYFRHAVHRATPDLASSGDPVAQCQSDLGRMAQDTAYPFIRWTAQTGNA